MDNSSPSMLKPTLIGGVACGVAGGLPFIGAINCACCALVMGAGFLAAYLYSGQCKRAGAEFRPGGGALVGLVAGLFYAVAHTAVGAFFRPDPGQIEEIIGQMEDQGAPAEAVDMVSRMMETFAGGLGIVFLFFFMLLVGAVFATIGGLIGGAVFKVAPTTPAPPAPRAGGEGGMA
jgi:hypothetical protein